MNEQDLVTALNFLDKAQNEIVGLMLFLKNKPEFFVDYNKSESILESLEDLADLQNHRISLLDPSPSISIDEMREILSFVKEDSNGKE